MCAPQLIFWVLRKSISNNTLSREQFVICYLFTFFAIPTPGKYGPPNSIFELVYIHSTAVWTLTSIRPLLAKNEILYVADSTETYSRSHLDMKTSGRIWEIPLAKHSLYYISEQGKLCKTPDRFFSPNCLWTTFNSSSCTKARLIWHSTKFNRWDSVSGTPELTNISWYSQNIHKEDFVRHRTRGLSSLTPGLHLFLCIQYIHCTLLPAHVTCMGRLQLSCYRFFIGPFWLLMTRGSWRSGLPKHDSKTLSQKLTRPHNAGTSSLQSRAHKTCWFMESTHPDSKPACTSSIKIDLLLEYHLGYKPQQPHHTHTHRQTKPIVAYFVFNFQEGPRKITPHFTNIQLSLMHLNCTNHVPIQTSVCLWKWLLRKTFWLKGCIWNTLPQRKKKRLPRGSGISWEASPIFHQDMRICGTTNIKQVVISVTNTTSALGHDHTSAALALEFSLREQCDVLVLLQRQRTFQPLSDLCIWIMCSKKL